MRTVIAILILILIGSMIVINDKETNAGLPLVHASYRHGFVCVPAITPHTGPVRSRELT
jgi:hypothetical protein